MKLDTTYMGLKLTHPVVASASPLSRTLDGIRRLEDAGAAAVVMYSLFEEGNDRHEYLELIRKAKGAMAIPVIGSLNAISPDAWTGYAREIEQAGADALELDMYFHPVDPLIEGAEVERRYLDVARDVRRSVRIPLSVKMVPYFSSPANMAAKLVDAGADSLVLFNRFHQTDFDLEQSRQAQHPLLSSAHELRLPLHWTAILFGHIACDLAITSGVQSYLEALKGVMAGAGVVMMASELMRHGISRIGDVVSGMSDWLKLHDHESIDEIRGIMCCRNVADPSVFERANYMRMLQSWHVERRPDID